MNPLPGAIWPEAALGDKTCYESDFGSHADSGAIGDWPGYVDVSAFIEARYQSCYGANIACNYPAVIAVFDSTQQCLAAVGYRTNRGRLFLEQYLDASVEQSLSSVYQKPIERNAIVEIGNLVGTQGHAVYTLMQFLWRHLMAQGYEHIVMTCTAAMLRRFRRLPYKTLAQANKTRVVNAANWGNYYAQNPEVITGQLKHYDHRFSRFIKDDKLTVRVLSAPEVV